MAFERSHGKARPTLPRASDAQRDESARNPADGRDAQGRFAPGNRVSVGARQKATIRKLLGPRGLTGDAAVVQSDALRLYLGTLRALPSEAIPVRTMTAMHSRHAALAAFFTAKATELGLDTERGIALLELASQHGQRAERLIVTAQDLSRVLAKSEREKPITIAELEEAAKPRGAS